MQWVIQHGVQGENDWDAEGVDDIEVQGVSAQMQQSVVQGDNDKILQGDGKSMSGDGLDWVQCVQGQHED